VTAPPTVRVPDEPPDVSDPRAAKALWHLVQHLAGLTGVSTPPERDHDCSVPWKPEGDCAVPYPVDGGAAA
jgi:hypothetical protein